MNCEKCGKKTDEYGLCACGHDSSLSAQEIEQAVNEKFPQD